MAGDIQWYDGAVDVSSGAQSAIPDQPRIENGGPIEVPDGLDGGHSFGNANGPANAVDSPSQGSGSVIDSSVND